MNDLLFRIENKLCYTEVRSTEKGYKLISFMPKYGRQETNYYDNEYFSKETKWSKDEILKHADLEASGAIESIEDMKSKINIMSGLIEMNKDITDELKEAYVKGNVDTGIIIQLKFVDHFPERNKALFVNCIMSSIIENIIKSQGFEKNIKQVEIQILK